MYGLGKVCAKTCKIQRKSKKMNCKHFMGLKIDCSENMKVTKCDLLKHISVNTHIFFLQGDVEERRRKASFMTLVVFVNI